MKLNVLLQKPIISLSLAILFQKESGVQAIGRQDKISQPADSNAIVSKGIREIKVILKEQEDKKDIINFMTVFVASTAVIVSGWAAHLNYKAFRGQSIANFRKSWNTNLINSMSEFIVASLSISESIKSGVMPANFEIEVLNLRKIYYASIFQLNEINFHNHKINNILLSIISVISKAKHNPSDIVGSDFDNLIVELSKEINVITNGNWNIINDFQ